MEKLKAEIESLGWHVHFGDAVLSGYVGTGSASTCAISVTTNGMKFHRVCEPDIEAQTRALEMLLQKIKDHTPNK